MMWCRANAGGEAEFDCWQHFPVKIAHSIHPRYRLHVDLPRPPSDEHVFDDIRFGYDAGNMRHRHAASVNATNYVIMHASVPALMRVCACA